MKTRPIFPLLLSMSLPMVISMLVNSLYNIIDSFFVAKISEDAMTSLSLVFPVQNFISALLSALVSASMRSLPYILVQAERKRLTLPQLRGLPFQRCTALC